MWSRAYHCSILRVQWYSAHPGLVRWISCCYTLPLPTISVWPWDNNDYRYPGWVVWQYQWELFRSSLWVFRFGRKSNWILTALHLLRFRLCGRGWSNFLPHKFPAFRFSKHHDLVVALETIHPGWCSLEMFSWLSCGWSKTLNLSFVHRDSNDTMQELLFAPNTSKRTWLSRGSSNHCNDLHRFQHVVGTTPNLNHHLRRIASYLRWDRRENRSNSPEMMIKLGVVPLHAETGAIVAVVEDPLDSQVLFDVFGQKSSCIVVVGNTVNKEKVQRFGPSTESMKNIWGKHHPGDRFPRPIQGLDAWRNETREICEKEIRSTSSAETEPLKEAVRSVFYLISTNRKP